MQKQCGEMRKKHGLSTLGGTRTRQTALGRLHGRASVGTLGGTQTRGQTACTGKGRVSVGRNSVGNKREELKGAPLR